MKKPSTTYLMTRSESRKAVSCVRNHLATLGIRAQVSVTPRGHLKVTPATAADYRQWAGAEFHVERHCGL
jgi:hypothetical protein